jgi:uncharacterized protein (DUF433 family)
MIFDGHQVEHLFPYNQLVPEPRRSLATQTDTRNAPAYPLVEAARYLRLPPATLRAWTVGRPYPTTAGPGRFQPLIRPAARTPVSLSFWNLIEAHVLRALRIDHGVSVKAVRKALQFAQSTLGIERLLLSPELRSRAGEVFLDRYGQLINLSASGQLAIRQVLEAHLRRVEWDDRKVPIRLHPFLIGDAPDQGRAIVIDALVSFGRPMLASSGVSTAAIVSRIDAGESPDDVAADYGVSVRDVDAAVVYERVA